MSNPFNIVLHEDRYHICLGNQKVNNDSYESITDALEYLKSEDWNLILNVCAIIVHNALIFHKLIPSPGDENKADEPPVRHRFNEI